MDEVIQIEDCWNRIGVWSHAATRCPQLRSVVHCRNCATYSAAGRALLERELSHEARVQLAARYAQPADYARSRQGASFTVFRICGEWLALPTRVVQCVTEPQPTRRIPHRNNPLLRGVANFSGSVELVVSFEALLGIDAASVHSGANHRVLPRMLLLNKEAGGYAFAVSEVWGVHRQDEARLATVPSTLERALLHYVRGTMEVERAGERHRVGVLDFDLLSYSVEQALK